MKQLSVSIVVVILGCCLPSAHGQKLKFPSLLPFKKQPEKVQPYKLSDSAGFSLMPSPKAHSGLKSPPLVQSVGEYSKQFWKQAGQNLSHLANDAKNILTIPDSSPLKSTFSWTPWRRNPDPLPPLRPKHRMASELLATPKQRF